MRHQKDEHLFSNIVFPKKYYKLISENSTPEGTCQLSNRHQLVFSLMYFLFLSADKLYLRKAPQDPTGTTFSNLKRPSFNLVFLLPRTFCAPPPPPSLSHSLSQQHTSTFCFFQFYLGFEDKHVMDLANEVRHLLSEAEVICSWHTRSYQLQCSFSIYVWKVLMVRKYCWDSNCEPWGHVWTPYSHTLCHMIFYLSKWIEKFLVY